MADSRADSCLAQHTRLVQVRQSYEPVWQQIDERINPTGVQFGRSVGDTSKGRQPTSHWMIQSESMRSFTSSTTSRCTGVV